MPYQLSPTKLSLFRECPRCFWLSMNAGIKRPAMIFPSLPSGMDLVLKHYFDNCRNNGCIPIEVLKLGDNITLFNDITLLTHWRNMGKGLIWRDRQGNILTGLLDDCLVKNKKLIVLDFKTRGYPLKDDDSADYYQDSLDIYTLLLKLNGYDTENYAYLLFYYPEKVSETGGNILFRHCWIKKQVDISRAKKLFQDATKLLGGKIPDPSDTCEFCHNQIRMR